MCRITFYFFLSICIFLIYVFISVYQIYILSIAKESYSNALREQKNYMLNVCEALNEKSCPRIMETEPIQFSTSAMEWRKTCHKVINASNIYEITSKLEFQAIHQVLEEYGQSENHSFLLFILSYPLHSLFYITILCSLLLGIAIFCFGPVLCHRIWKEERNRYKRKREGEERKREGEEQISSVFGSSSSFLSNFHDPEEKYNNNNDYNHIDISNGTRNGIRNRRKETSNGWFSKLL